MKIALVVVLCGDLVRSTEHVGIGYLAAVLRQHKHDVDVLEVYEDEILKNQYDMQWVFDCGLIGFTTTCITMKYVALMAKHIKEANPTVFIACGGHMATFSSEDILNTYPEIDCTIRGEGELTILELVDVISESGSLKEVFGISFRNTNGITHNPDRALIDNLDSLPFPARDQFEQHQNDAQYLRLSTSRGCLGTCGFCSSFVGRAQAGPKWRGRSPVNVVDEIESLVKKYDFHTFDFVDSSFEDPGRAGKRRIGEIAAEIVKRDLKVFFNCCFRAENWSDTDAGLIQVLVDAGLEKVNIGFESGNNNGLRILNKIATIEDNWRALNMLKAFPYVYVTFGFIMLHPYSTLSDICDNASFLRKTGYGQIIRHYFWTLEVYPGTLLEEQLKKDKLIDEKYDLEEGMYKYRFLNDDVAWLAPVFQDMLSVQVIWDFEIFDILIHTFVTRLQRTYCNKTISCRINAFSNYVTQIRAEMADKNYNLFLDLLSRKYTTGQLKERLDYYHRSTMQKIKAEQYKLGVFIKRNGFSIDIK